MENSKNLSIGQKIRELRTRKGYSQEVIASMLDMSTNGYAKIEQDKTPNLSLKRLEQIAETLESSIYELLSIGEKNAYYISTQSGGNSGFHYTVNQHMPQEYQHLKVENKSLVTGNEFLKEKIQLLEREIENLKKINALLEQKGA